MTSLGTIVKLFWASVSFLLWDCWTTRSLKYTSSAQNEQVPIYPNTLVRKIILPVYSDILSQLYRILIYINARHFYCSENIIPWNRSVSKFYILFFQRSVSNIWQIHFWWYPVKTTESYHLLRKKAWAQLWDISQQRNKQVHGLSFNWAK